MKIVCDIPEGMLDELHTCKFPIQDAYRLCAVIENGTPLPKGHGDLKDMGNLQYVFDLTREDSIYSGKDIERAIKSMKTIIEADKVCTYKETGCGSCRWQIECPYDEADKEGTDE